MRGARRRLRRPGDVVSTTALEQAEAALPVTVPVRAVPSGPVLPSAPMPAELVAAAREARDDEDVRLLPVRLELAGGSVIAVIGGDGDPREWWTAVWRIAEADAGAEAGTEASAVPSAGVRYQALPAGLSALAVRQETGELAVSVSDAIEPERQRAAVKAALSASRRAARKPGFALIGELAQASRFRAAAAVAVVILLVASVAIAVALGRHHQGQAVGLSGPGLAAGPAQNHSSGRSRPGTTPLAAGGSGRTGGTSAASGSPTKTGRGKPTSRPSPSPSASRVPSPSPSPSPSASSSSSPSPPSGTTSPGPTPSSDPPSSSPSATPSPSSSGSCVVILGITVCV
jgi:hypothetical protein